LRKLFLSLIFAVFALAVGVFFAFAQSSVVEKTKLTMTGDVVAVDWVGNKLSVNGTDGIVTITVSDETKIVKGTEAVDATELGQGTHVEIAYVNQPDNSIKALAIMITDPI
jgi:hypothetical protein